MVYGIQATGDTIITDIARAVAAEDKHRNVENRLSRNLQAEGLHEKIRDAIQADAVRFIDRNTLVIYDPTDVLQAPFVQDGEAFARPGRKQVVEGERRDDAGLPRVHGRRLQVGRTEDRAARPQDLVLARRGPQGRERGSPRRHAGRRQGDGRTRHPRLRQGRGQDPPSTTTSSTTRGSSSRA